MRRVRSSTSILAPETKRLKTEHDINTIISNSDNAAMMKSKEGLAWMFVNKVNERHKRIAGSPKGNPAVSTVSIDDMVELTEKFLDCQKCFQQSNTPNNVTLAYHYTNKGAINSIKQNGLMTPTERCSMKRNGAVYGDGIYTATNPFAFQDRYGEVGLIVAVIKGKTQRVKKSPSHISGGTNTVIGNKVKDRSKVIVDSDSNEFYDEVVLLESSQCLPLVKFSSNLVSKTEDDSTGNNTIWAYHREMQRVVDTFFNGGSHTELHRIFPSMNIYIPVEPSKIKIIFQQFKRSATKMIKYQNNNFKRHKRPRPNETKPMPIYQTISTPQTTVNPQSNIEMQVQRETAHCIHNSIKSKEKYVTGQHTEAFLLLQNYNRLNQNGAVTDVLIYKAPESLSGDTKSSYFQKANSMPSTCPICMEQIHDSLDVVSLKVCSHQFHRSCIERALNTFHCCPICRKCVREPRGPQPSGRMSISKISKPCNDFENCQQTICISYNLSDGIQKSYHENPGHRFTGASRRAYLPDNKDGRELLERLKYAWLRGLIFRVGTSLTTGKHNSVVWSSIHHKTSRHGGPHGYPDDRYFSSCNGELDSLGVPKALECTERVKNMIAA